MELNGTVALVTGGASGLGLATAHRLAAGGARVAVVDLASSGGEAAAEALGGGAVFVPADVTDEDQVRGAVEAAGGLGALRIVVNCAGIANAIRVIGRDGTPFPLADFRRVIEINLVGTFNVVRLAAARMVAETPVEGEERGVIVNTASVAAYEGQIGQAAYSAAKAGVVGLTLPVARDLAHVYGIPVEVTDSALATQTVTGWYDGEPFDDVFAIVCGVLQARCEVENGVAKLGG